MTIEKVDVIDGEMFDLGIFGLGYESRSIDCFCKIKSTCNKSIALGYTYWNDEFDYLKNKAEYENNNCKVIEINENDIRENLEKSLYEEIKAINGRIFIDISVMTRHRLSELLWFMFDELNPGTSIIVAYSIAEYVEPPNQNYPVKFFGSIIEKYQPLTGRLNLQQVVIIGLGYEKDKALGAIGHLDPENVIFLIPTNDDAPDFGKQIHQNNKQLFDNYAKSESLTYDVLKPYSTYFELKSLILGLKNDYRVLLIPLGPKILAVICLIIAREFFPDINIWRVSSQQYEKPLNREPSGKYSYIKIVI